MLPDLGLRLTQPPLQLCSYDGNPLRAIVSIWSQKRSSSLSVV
jgi:hypothetical protein